MRTVSEKSIKSFLNHKNGKFGGVCNNPYCNANGKVNSEVKDDTYYLFGNAIMKFENDNLYIRLHTLSNTTRERLNSLSYFGYKVSVTQRNYTPYLNGEHMDSYRWYKVEKI